MYSVFQQEVHGSDNQMLYINLLVKHQRFYLSQLAFAIFPVLLTDFLLNPFQIQYWYLENILLRKLGICAKQVFFVDFS